MTTTKKKAPKTYERQLAAVDGEFRTQLERTRKIILDAEAAGRSLNMEEEAWVTQELPRFLEILQETRVEVCRAMAFRDEHLARIAAVLSGVDEREAAEAAEKKAAAK